MLKDVGFECTRFDLRFAHHCYCNQTLLFIICSIWS